MHPDIEEIFRLLWAALDAHEYPEKQWEDICWGMAVLREELNLPPEVERENS